MKFEELKFGMTFCIDATEDSGNRGIIYISPDKTILIDLGDESSDSLIDLVELRALKDEDDFSLWKTAMLDSVTELNLITTISKVTKESIDRDIKYYKEKLEKATSNMSIIEPTK